MFTRPGMRDAFLGRRPIHPSTSRVRFFGAFSCDFQRPDLVERRVEEFDDRARRREPFRYAGRPELTRRRSLSRSPIRRLMGRRSPRRSRSPVRRARSRSRSRDRRRSGSAMSISDGEAESAGGVFSGDFRPVVRPPKRAIKMAVAGAQATRDASPPPDQAEHAAHGGHRIRNAPPPTSDELRRRSRWDSGAAPIPLPDPKDLLAKQGVENPDRALANIAMLPSMAEERYKAKVDDETAIQQQLKMLEQQDKIKQLTQNLPANIRQSLEKQLFNAGGKLLRPPQLVEPAAGGERRKEPPPQPKLEESVSVNALKQQQAPGLQLVPPMMAGLPPPPFLLPMLAAGLLPPAAAPISAMTIAPPSTSAAAAAHMPKWPMPPAAAFPPPGVVPGMPPLLNVAPPPFVVDPTEQLFRARADLYRRDLMKIANIPDLLKYLWSQGFDQIPAGDPPLLFNDVIKRKPGILGASALYQIICYQHPELETYYCGMCNHWSTVSEMFPHLTAEMHRMNFLFRNYKVFHKKASDCPSGPARDRVLNFVAQKISKLEGSGQVVNRMRCILNIEDIRRIWPEYHVYVDHSWKVYTEDNEEPDGLVEMPVPAADRDEPRLNSNKIVVKTSLNSVLAGEPVGQLEKVKEPPAHDGDRDRSRDRDKERSREKERLREKEREREREREREKERERERERERSRSRRSRSKDRSRARSRDKRGSRRSVTPPARKPARSPVVLDEHDWEKKTAAFIAELGNDGMSSALKSLSKGPNKVQDLEATRASLRKRQEAETEQTQQKLTRRALGILMELQKLQDTQGFVERSMIYAVAEEMGMDAEAVKRSKIIQQGLGSLRVVDKKPDKTATAAREEDEEEVEEDGDARDADAAQKQRQQQSGLLHALGIDPAEMQRLFDRVAAITDAPARPDADAHLSLVYPTADSEAALSRNPVVRGLRLKMESLKQRLNEPLSKRAVKRIQLEKADLEKALESEYAKVCPAKKEELFSRLAPQPKRDAAAAADLDYREELPGSWSLPARSGERAARGLDAPSISSATTTTTAAAATGRPRCDPKKVEREWTDYYLKNPTAIDEPPSSEYGAESYDSYYGPGTFKVFCAAKEQAKRNAQRLLDERRAPPKGPAAAAAARPRGLFPRF